MTLFNSAEVEQVLLPNVRDLGDGFQVRRALPSAQRRMVVPSTSSTASVRSPSVPEKALIRVPILTSASPR